MLSHLKQVTDHKGNVVKYDYDGNGNQTAIAYPDNSVVTYEYDGASNLTSVTESDDWATT